MNVGWSTIYLPLCVRTGKENEWAEWLCFNTERTLTVLDLILVRKKIPVNPAELLGQDKLHYTAQ